MTMGTWWALVGMSIAAMGFYGSKGPFFAMPPMFLTGPAGGGHRLDQFASAISAASSDPGMSAS